MILYPAIDLLGGRCVRLYQGDYDQDTTYADDPVDQAGRFVAEGAEWLHVVDLDAARSGLPTNHAVIAGICEAVGVPVQVGGGVRTVEAAEALFEVGAARVVIGTAALENPELVSSLTARGHRVAVGLDAHGDDVATHGWTERSGRSVSEVAAGFADAGVDALVVTEISRDGTMEGPDVAGLQTLLAQTPIPIIASGGVGTLDDLRSLDRIEVDGRAFGGVICGRALYEGAFSVPQALEVLR